MSVQLAPYTTFRLGGPCRGLIDCQTPDQLKSVIARAGKNAILIGGGSNLLVSDAGVDATVIRYYSETPQVMRDGDELMVYGGTLLDDLARIAVEQGLEGLVCCTGIPGTVGGAIVGNAGAFGEQIGDRLVSVSLLDGDVSPADLQLGYRRSRLQGSGEIVLSARLKLTPGDAAKLRKHRDEILSLRASKHPDWRKTPTAGSFFKNIEPTSKAERRQAAGWFLEQAGAKDFRVGGARTYEKHANIIIAEKNCTAMDVHRLALKMADAVRDKFGLELQREVRLIGGFDE